MSRPSFCLQFIDAILMLLLFCYSGRLEISLHTWLLAFFTRVLVFDCFLESIMDFIAGNALARLLGASGADASLVLAIRHAVFLVFGAEFRRCCAGNTID